MTAARPRAREWRRSKSSAAPNVDTEARSDAPKALASSLIRVDLMQDELTGSSDGQIVVRDEPALADGARIRASNTDNEDREQHHKLFFCGVNGLRTRRDTAFPIAAAPRSGVGEPAGTASRQRACPRDAPAALHG